MVTRNEFRVRKEREKREKRERKERETEGVGN
jgi:hypothetical protein